MDNGRECSNCRFWSDQVARQWVKKVQAHCLNPKSASYRMFRPGSHSCVHWKENTHGAIDDPEIANGAYEEAAR